MTPAQLKPISDSIKRTIKAKNAVKKSSALIEQSAKKLANQALEKGLGKTSVSYNYANEAAKSARHSYLNMLQHKTKYVDTKKSKTLSKISDLVKNSSLSAANGAVSNELKQKAKANMIKQRVNFEKSKVRKVN